MLGNMHEHTLALINHTASRHGKQSRVDEAEPLFAEALRVRRETLGDMYSYTFNLIAEMADMSQVKGRSDEAEQLHVETLRIKLVGC